jgi:excisionase family DNA binding protein
MTTPSPKELERAIKNIRHGLEQLESALLEFEEMFKGESTVRPQERRGLELLSIAEVCQDLGMGKSWVYKRLRSGEIPSVKFGRSVKVKRQDLEEYIERHHHYRPANNSPS